MEGTLAAVKKVAKGFCTACWTGEYPTKLTDLKKGLIGSKC
jgi:glutamine phosphoribosylpyrophosphate amidotransferase